MRFLCPKCQRTQEATKVIKEDPKTKKSWLITQCLYCNYNYDIEEKATSGAAKPRKYYYDDFKSL